MHRSMQPAQSVLSLQWLDQCSHTTSIIGEKCSVQNSRQFGMQAFGVEGLQLWTTESANDTAPKWACAATLRAVNQSCLLPFRGGFRLERPC